jgi:hypothetical protein
MLKSLPKLVPFTLAGVSIVSWVFAPECVLSYLHVGTFTGVAVCAVANAK